MTTAAKPCSHSRTAFDGEELELIQLGQAPYVFRAENVTDDEGTKRELFNVPQMRVHFAFPFKVSEEWGHFAEGQGTARIVLIE